MSADQEEPSLPVKGRVKPLNAKTLAALPSMLAVTKDNIEYIEGAIRSEGNPPKLIERYKAKLAELQRSYEWLDSVIKAHQ